MLLLLALLIVVTPISVAQNIPWWCRVWPQICPQTRCCPTGGIWSSWKEKTPCTDVCGAFGTQTVERNCLTRSTCGPCRGPKQKTIRCNPTPCQFPRNSCAENLRAAAKGNQILCIDPNEVVEQIAKASCCIKGGLMEITDWTSCNGARCGTCDVSTRQKSCRTKDYGCGECSEKEAQETRPCTTAPCQFPQPSCCAGLKAQAVNNQIVCA